jgi:hypothetical protein
MDIREFLNGKTKDSVNPKHIIVKNFTNIKYNDRLKTFMIKMRTDLDYCFEILLNELNLQELGDMQEIMRNYIENHKDEIDFIVKNKPIYKPDFFALLIVAGSNFEHNISYDECLLEYRGNVMEVEFDYEDEEHTKCICGKKIKCKNGYITYNNKTQLHLVLGCECIKKNKILTTWTMALYEKRRNFNIFKNKLYLYGINSDEIDEWFYCGGNNKLGSKYFKDLYKELPSFECGNECVCSKNITGLENHYISKDNENFLIICKDCKKFFKKKSMETNNSKKREVCDHCQGTGEMYYCDDCWGDCMFC